MKAGAAVRRGIPCVVLDPSGPLARLTELPELRDHSEHLDLTTAASGTLNPFEVIADPDPASFGTEDAYLEAQVLAAQDRKRLAWGVIRMLLPASVDAMAQTALVVADAVRSTQGAVGSSLWDVVHHLEELESPHGRVVASYLGDVPLLYTRDIGHSLYDLESVQVLRGPQGTLFGKNSTGGAVIFNPAKPGTSFGGFVSGNFGDYDLAEVSGAVNLPVNDQLQVRVAGNFGRRHGYTKNILGPDLNNEHYQSGRISVNWAPNDVFENYAFVDATPISGPTCR